MIKTKRHISALLFAGLLVGSSMAYADDDLDVTMRMVPPGVELPDAVTKVISLPPVDSAHTPATAVTNAQDGLDTANSARGSVEIPQVQVPSLPDPAKGRGRH
jgi:hypothetical protein